MVRLDGAIENAVALGVADAVADVDDTGATLRIGDTLTVSCTHDQSLRDKLPSFEGQPERYVVWGEGTTDEMCLGIVMVTRP